MNCSILKIAARWERLRIGIICLAKWNPKQGRATIHTSKNSWKSISSNMAALTHSARMSLKCTPIIWIRNILRKNKVPRRRFKEYVPWKSFFMTVRASISISRFSLKKAYLKSSIINISRKMNGSKLLKMHMPTPKRWRYVYCCYIN